MWWVWAASELLVDVRNPRRTHLMWWVWPESAWPSVDTSSTGGTSGIAPADEETGFLTPCSPTGRRRASLRLAELKARLKSLLHLDEDETTCAFSRLAARHLPDKTEQR